VIQREATETTVLLTSTDVIDLGTNPGTARHRTERTQIGEQA
jgi:hypothetical protein